jgi:hypothetical protein
MEDVGEANLAVARGAGRSRENAVWGDGGARVRRWRKETVCEARTLAGAWSEEKQTDEIYTTY